MSKEEYSAIEILETIVADGFLSETNAHRAQRIIASKATEEGELLNALEKIAAIEDKSFGGDWDEIEEAREIARQAIAADRASRQVANKAEVELDAARYRWLRNHGDKEGQPPVMLQGRWYGGSNGVGFNLDEAVDSLMGIATPPATTGASTARSIDTLDFHNLLRMCMKHSDDYPTHSARLIDYINSHFAGAAGASIAKTGEQ